MIYILYIVQNSGGGKLGIIGMSLANIVTSEIQLSFLLIKFKLLSTSMALLKFFQAMKKKLNLSDSVMKWCQAKY